MSKSLVATSVTDWSDPQTRAIVDLVAEGITELAGFEVAVIGIVQGEEWVAVAVAGDEDARREILGMRRPLADVVAQLARAEDWGLLRFVPHDRIDPRAPLAWVPDLEQSDEPDAWQPLDMLFAPIEDSAGQLRGFMAVDLPADRRRPDEARRDLLQKYAAQATRSVLLALERAELAERVRMLRAAQEVCRRASRELEIANVVDECQAAIMEGFSAFGMWLRTVDTNSPWPLHTIAPGVAAEFSAEVLAVVDDAAREAWHRQEVATLNLDRPLPEHLFGDSGRPVLRPAIRLFAENGVGHALFVPLGAGEECLGCLWLTRPVGAPEWTDVEREVALEIGHDLGSALVNARAFERELQLVSELQALDAYKSQLIATLSHELKSPLTSIVGNLELLRAEPGLSDPVRRALDAAFRGSRRLTGLVDNLLLLAKVGDPHTPPGRRRLDLRRVLEEVVDSAAYDAEARGVGLRLSVPREQVEIVGDAMEMRSLLANLVGNAVKYSSADGTVDVGLERRGDLAVISVADTGIGIAAEDQERLFSEFFRSTDPAASSRPGTGLGLAIAHRIATRHGGRIDVSSQPGVGSTFTVTLPAD